MKRFALTTMLAGSIVAGAMGAAGTASANFGYWDPSNPYNPYYGPGYGMHRVDTSVHTNTVIVRH